MISKLLADVVSQCPHCETMGTVSTMTSHIATTHAAEQHRNTLHTIDQHHPVHDLDFDDDLDMDDVDHERESPQWLNAVLGLHAANPQESAGYLTTWITSFVQINKLPPFQPFDALFRRVPMHVLDVCETVWPSTQMRCAVDMMIEMHDMLSQWTGEPGREAVQRRVTDNLVAAFASDDSAVLSVLANMQGSSVSSSTLRDISRKALGPFARRLHTMANPTPTHAELLLSAILWDNTIDVDEHDLADWLTPILHRPDLHQWCSDDWMARCIVHAAADGSQLLPVLEPFVQRWLARRAAAPPPLGHEVFYTQMASVVAGVYAFDVAAPMPAATLYEVFSVMSRFDPSVLGPIFCASVWKAFVHDQDWTQ